MKKKMYLVHGGKIMSKYDKDIHFVSAHDVARLYNLKKGQYCTPGVRGKMDASLFIGVLYPRFDGNYEDLSYE